MTKRKAEQPATDTKEAPPKKKKLTMKLLSEQDEKITDHLNMTVRRVNMTIEHLNFLNAKFLQFCRLYNGELRSVKDRIKRLESCPDGSGWMSPQLPDIFPDLPNEALEPIPYTIDLENGDDTMMSENDLISVVGQFAENC